MPLIKPSSEKIAPFGLKLPKPSSSSQIPHTPRRQLLLNLTSPSVVRTLICFIFLCIVGNIYRTIPSSDEVRKTAIKYNAHSSSNNNVSPLSTNVQSNIQGQRRLKSAIEINDKHNEDLKIKSDTTKSKSFILENEVKEEQIVKDQEQKIQETCFTLSSILKDKSLKTGGGYLLPPPNEKEFLNAIGDSDSPLLERCFYLHKASNFMIANGIKLDNKENAIETGDKLPVFIGSMPFTDAHVSQKQMEYKFENNRLLYMDTKKDKWVFKMHDMSKNTLSIDNLFILEKQKIKEDNDNKNEESLYAIRHYSSGAYINIIDANGLTVRGHGNKPYKLEKSNNARQQDRSSTIFQLSFQSKDVIKADIKQNEISNLEEKELENLLIEKIKEFENTKDERRVISYGLYGSRPKYTNGAIRNAELRDTYFPGWELWYYHDNQVPNHVIEKLKSFPAVRLINCGKNDGIMGMFWRFKVADEAEVDRYIVRDVDSRLNSRERIAVEDWIKSDYPIHLLRDHVNHCHPFNGGMWGGIKGAFNDIGGLNKQIKNNINGKKTQYMGDMNFLNEDIYPKIKSKVLSHDAYCCGEFENSKPFPTKRPSNYQHVGQVFDANDQPRMGDIDGFIRGKKIPPQCRRKEDWIYG